MADSIFAAARRSSRAVGIGYYTLPPNVFSLPANYATAHNAEGKDKDSLRRFST